MFVLSDELTNNECKFGVLPIGPIKSSLLYKVKSIHGMHFIDNLCDAKIADYGLMFIIAELMSDKERNEIKSAIRVNYDKGIPVFLICISKNKVKFDRARLLINPSDYNSIDEMEDKVTSSIKTFCDILSYPGMVNLEPADVKDIFSEKGFLKYSSKEAVGEYALQDAMKKCLDMINKKLSNVSYIIVNVTGSEDWLSFADIHCSLEMLYNKLENKSCTILWGVNTNEEFYDKIQVYMLARGEELKM